MFGLDSRWRKTLPGVLLLLALAWLTLGTGVVADEGGGDTQSGIEWRPGPAITGAIKKSIDAQWFHISETCTLRAKGTDVDEKKVGDGEWAADTGNHIDLAHTTWSGPGLSESEGAEVQWHKTTPTGESGVTVSATFTDYANDPHPDANDPGSPSAVKAMYAYEALAFLNCTGGGDSPTTSVSETTGAGETGMKYICMYTLYDTKTVTASNEDFKVASINTGANATWVLRTNPSTASLGTNGQLKVAIKADVNGNFLAHVYDDDWAEGSVTVNVGISLNVPPVGVTISTPISFGSDESEGVVAMGFGFSSDDLGGDDQDTLAIRSSSYDDDIWGETYSSHGSGELLFGYANTATIRGAIGKESRAVATVQGRAEAKTRDDGDDAKATMTIGEVVVPPDMTGSYHPANARYFVGVPTYEPGTAPGAEEGY